MDASKVDKVAMLEEVKQWAKDRGGECLATEYVNCTHKMLFRCEKEHEFYSYRSALKAGEWCPYCAGKYKDIKFLQELAASKGGKILSTEYKRLDTKYLWECSKGHQWEANASNVFHLNRWCPECGRKKADDARRQYSLEDMQKFAASRGGVCLSDSFESVIKKLRWRCAEGHEWEAKPHNLMNGGWCPRCKKGLGERVCRAYFEQLLGESFKSVRPKWLMSPAGFPMELDGYSAKLKIAFEHQGIQHYERIEFFEESSCFDSRQARDEAKRVLCAQHGIALIEVPSVLDILKKQNLKQFIKDELTKKGIVLPANFDQIEVDLSGIYEPNKLQELQEIAASHNGMLISDKYLGMFEKLEWECARGHKFHYNPNNIKHNKRWCPECNKDKRSLSYSKTLTISGQLSLF